MVAQLSIPSLAADIILTSRQDVASEFRVHKCVLAAASPFFHDMFCLPQSSEECQTISLSESGDTIRTLLQFIYPVEDPTLDSLEELVTVLTAAAKYDMISVVKALGKILVQPRFVDPDPIRVFAVASEFDMEEEAKIISSRTLKVNILDAPLSDDLKHISAYTYARLLAMHHRRATAALALLKDPGHIRCMQCNASPLSTDGQPKWWIEFERKARQELSVRPTTDVIFRTDFLAQVAMSSGCTRCPGSILDSWKFLDDLKREIDLLPSTI